MAPWYQNRWAKRAFKGKLALSGAETAREFLSWYNNKWKQDYPRAYRNRYRAHRNFYKNLKRLRRYRQWR